MAYKRKKRQEEKVELSMTPMIDVVFQLLIFFVVNLKQEDIFARLTAARPQPNANKVETQNQDPPISIIVEAGSVRYRDRPDGKPAYKRDSKGKVVRDRAYEEIVPSYSFRGMPMSLERLDSTIKKLSERSKTAMVVIECRGSSLHSGLIKVLDICYKYEMKNLSILTR